MKNRKDERSFTRLCKEGDKVEFINGEVIFNSPVKLEHNKAGALLFKLLHTYISMKDIGFAGVEKILISLTRNDYEPDICFFKKSISDNFNPKQMQFPAPDFVVEVVSPSSEHNDRVIKFEDYAAHGIMEYLIIDPEKKTIEKYLLNKDKYDLFLKSDNGYIKSKAISGFEIPIDSVFNKDENLKILKSIIK